MRTHWHAFSYTGQERPRDSEARNPQAAVPPNEISMWFRKPRSMMDGTFTAAGPAAEWLEKELVESPPLDSVLSVECHMRSARGALEREVDTYVGYYTARGRFLVRAVLSCPRAGERCPELPPGEGAELGPRRQPPAR